MMIGKVFFTLGGHLIFLKSIFLKLFVLNQPPLYIPAPFFPPCPLIQAHLYAFITPLCHVSNHVTTLSQYLPVFTVTLILTQINRRSPVPLHRPTPR